MRESRSSFTDTTTMLMKVESTLADSTSLFNIVFTITPSKNWVLDGQKYCVPGGCLLGMGPGAHIVTEEILRHNFLSQFSIHSL